MEGRNYSWYNISQLLQTQLDKEVLEFNVEDGDVIFEWNLLCDEKREWDQKGRLSVSSAEFNRDCLINLKIIPIQGGLGFEGSQLVTSNTDKPNLLAKDLWVDPDKWESFTNYKSMESLTDDDNSSWSADTEESEYEDDESDDKENGSELESSEEDSE